MAQRVNRKAKVTLDPKVNVPIEYKTAADDWNRTWEVSDSHADDLEDLDDRVLVLEDGTAINSFPSLAGAGGATAYYDAASPKPDDNVNIYIEDVEEYYRWDSANTGVWATATGRKYKPVTDSVESGNDYAVSSKGVFANMKNAYETYAQAVSSVVVSNERDGFWFIIYGENADKGIWKIDIANGVSPEFIVKISSIITQNQIDKLSNVPANTNQELSKLFSENQNLVSVPTVTDVATQIADWNVGMPFFLELTGSDEYQQCVVSGVGTYVKILDFPNTTSFNKILNLPDDTNQDLLIAQSTADTAQKNQKPFTNRAAATSYWNSLTTKPLDGARIMIEDVKEIHAWDSSDATHRTVKVGDVIQKTDDLNDADQTKVPELSVVKAVDDKVNNVLGINQSTDNVYYEDDVINVTTVHSLLSLEKDNKYTLEFSSDDTLANGLEIFYGGVTIIKSFSSTEDFSAGVSLEFTPMVDAVLGIRTYLTNVNVVSKITKILNSSNVVDDVNGVKKVLDIEKTPITDFDESVNSNGNGVLFLLDLVKGNKYNISFSTNDTVNASGVRFYYEGVDIKGFSSLEDFATGVSFTYTPDEDGELGYRVYQIGIDSDIEITHTDYSSSILTPLDGLTDDLLVFNELDYDVSNTTTFLHTNFEKQRGATLNFNYKADYTGNFSIYSYNGSVLSEVLRLESTDFDISGGIDFDIVVPDDCITLTFRTFVSGVTIENLTATKVIINPIKLPILLEPWKNKEVSFFGDSITAITNGDFLFPFTDQYKWGNKAGVIHSMAKVYGRGIGGQKYSFGSNGGSVAFINTATGNYDSRNDSYNYDNYSGNVTVPAGTTPVRGAYSSWLRITTMYPASIKDDIDAVVIMGATNDSIDATALAWVENSVVDTEWSNSTEYSTYGGDYNLTSLEGGIASTIMKMQAWMPQARIIIATPLSGRGVKGELLPETPITEEYTKSVIVRKIAGIFSIPIIDVNAECGINGLNRPTFISDSVHPYSEDGSKALAMAMVGGLTKIYPRL